VAVADRTSATPVARTGVAARPAAAGAPGRVEQWAITAVPVIALVVMGWQRRWMSDDGFIHLRVVEQLTGGNGPVFNVGERVEASTSPLWVAILTVADLFGGFALPWKAVVLGIVCAGTGLLLAQRAGIRLARQGGDVRTVLPLGAAVVAAMPPFWDYATSGLETGLIFGWLGGSQWWCAHRVTATRVPRLRADLAGAAWVGLGYLIHPDLALFTVAFGAVLVVSAWPAGRWRVTGLLGAMAGLPVAYQIFRMGYYALLVPNTALTKEASRSQWGQGWRYLADFALPYWLWVPVGALIGLLATQTMADVRAGARLRAACRAAPALAAVGHALYIVRVGGDFMHARLLLPALFAMVAPVSLPLSVADLRLARSPLRVATAGLVAAWAVVCALALPRDGSVPRIADGTIEDERLAWGGEVRLDLLSTRWGDPRPGEVRAFDVDRLGVVAVPLRSGVEFPAASVSVGGMGNAYAWDLDIYTIEHGSLADPVGSHLDHLVGERPGHQKPMPPVWQVAGLVEGTEVPDVDGVGLLVSSGDLAAAEHAMECGQLADYLDGIHEPLTAGRFLRNLMDSVANTRLRLSPDPQAAEDQMCDPDG
jgi:arabinofuranosyltransferase